MGKCCFCTIVLALFTDFRSKMVKKNGIYNIYELIY